MNKKIMLSTVSMASALFISTHAFATPASTFSGAINGAPNLTVVATDGNDADSATVLESTLKVPGSKKDLLIGVSLQSSLNTTTKAKGKNGESDSEEACATMDVTVTVDGYPVAPSTVTFNHRCQTLNTVLGGVIETCNVSTTDGSGVIDVDQDCVVTDEEIELILATTSANHFNFIAPDVGQGVHTIAVEVDVSASSNSVDSEGEVVVNVGSLSVETVRSANTDDGITID